jgi:hypothetical protein
MLTLAQPTRCIGSRRAQERRRDSGARWGQLDALDALDPRRPAPSGRCCDTRNRLAEYRPERRNTALVCVPT